MKITAEIRKIIMELCGDNENNIMGTEGLALEFYFRVRLCCSVFLGLFPSHTIHFSPKKGKLK